MDEVVARILSRLDPEVSIPPDATWQERRSGETRIALLEATIESLVQLGYARTSTTTIAGYARITRGAMGHHYATKLDLIAAVLDYALYKRMAIYIEEILRLGDAERRDPSLAMDLLVRNSESREYRTYLELLVASRGDPELNAVFLPKVRRYRHVWQSEMAKLFPGWEGKEALLFICSDFATLLNEALVLNAAVIEEPEARALLNRLAGRVIRMVRDGELDLGAAAPKPGKSRGGAARRKTARGA